MLINALQEERDEKFGDFWQVLNVDLLVPVAIVNRNRLDFFSRTVVICFVPLFQVVLKAPKTTHSTNGQM